MATVKKIPHRLCLGCHEVKPKKELIRIVRSPEGEYSLDFTGKKPGRGAYICKNAECFDKAQKTKQFNKSFREEVPSDTVKSLKEELFAADGAK